MFSPVLLALISIIPQPQKVAEGVGSTTNGVVRYETDAKIPAEGYRLQIGEKGATVWSADAAGRYYAGQTLGQLKDNGGWPCVEIEDAPRYRWRGLHFDDCRHFFGKETLKKTLDTMARYKFNRLHWHLTEDQGWRIEIPGYPELVKYGAVRSQSVRPGMKAWKGTKEDADKLDGTKYGPFYYTEADIREILAYAAERHIQVVPEIELPGHVYAALAAYPEFACVPANLASREPRLVWGIEKDVLCLGNDQAIKFMEDVLDYVCKLFPGDVIHIGGDECPQDRWKTCAKCQARIKAEKLGDEHGLQPWVTRHFVKFLEARGKRALGWDEYLLGDVPKSAIGMSWRESRSGAGHELVSGAAAAMRGHDVVMTPCSFCYLDYGQGLAEDPFFYIGGRVTLERCYSLDPCAGVPEAAKKHILGGQGNNWSEYTWNVFDLEWKMWPRACALAEVFWTGEKRPGFYDFRNRMALERRNLIAAGVNCAPLGGKPAETDGSFKIMSYNIRHGEAMDGKLELRNVGWRIAGERPRFAGLQEVDQKTVRVGGRDTCAVLAETTGMRATFAKAIEFGGGEYGNALLSREKPLAVRRVPLPGQEPRVLLLCEFEDCWAGVTHLAVDSEAARLGSIAAIREAVAACGAKPVFLMGDWNARPDSKVLAGLREFLTVVSDESAATFHGGKTDPAELANRGRCIDYIAVDTAHRGGYAVRGRRTIPDHYNSDHMPIVVAVEPLPVAKPEAAFTIASFNVRCPDDKGELKWYRRLPRAAEIVLQRDFDVFGVQEATPGELEILAGELPGFAYVGCGRDRDRSGESMYVFYRAERFDCIEEGTFWLSETPDEPGSKYKGAGCPRTCTWALLRDRVTGKTFRYFNTHLDHASSSARWEGMQVLLERGVRPAKSRGETVFLTGDLNETLDKADSPETIATMDGPALAESAKENTIALVSTELRDTYAASETPHTGTHRTFHGYKGNPRCRIDYVFSTPDVRILSHATVNDRPDGEFASDHYPVSAMVEIR